MAGEVKVKVYDEDGAIDRRLLPASTTFSPKAWSFISLKFSMDHENDPGSFFHHVFEPASTSHTRISATLPPTTKEIDSAGPVLVFPLVYSGKCQRSHLNVIH